MTDDSLNTRRTIRTMCPMNCHPTLCGMPVDVEARMLYPMVREMRGTDDWRRVSWYEALDRVVAGFRSVGREAMGLWPGHGALASGRPPMMPGWK